MGSGQKKTISIKNANIETAIQTILKNTGYTYRINGYHIIISKPEVLLQTIRGIVVDNSSGQPIPFANVSILNDLYSGVITDSLGYFTIPHVPVGRYNIKASFVGYEPRIIGEVVLTSAKEAYLEISLKENSQLLEEVVIHANIDKEATVNPLALTGGRVLTVEEASRFAGGFDDPARLVSSFAGVAGGINSNAIVVRGNSPQFTQWRMEGVEIPNPTHYADMTGLGGGLLTGLSSNVLGNSDFYNGAFPAGYTNALGGVFDMSMRNGNRTKHEHAFQVGIWGLDFASEGPISKKHNSSYIFNYRYSFSGISDAISGTDEGLDYQDIAFKVNFPTKRSGTFTLWGIGLLDKVLNKNEEDPAQWEYTSDKQRSDNGFTKAMFGLSHKIYINEETYLKSTLATTYSKVHAIIDQVDNDFKFHRMADMKNSNTDIILTSYINRKFNEKHTNRTGVTFTSLSYDLDFNKSDKPTLYESMKTIATGNGSEYALSAFTNSVVRISNTLDASIGLTGQLFSLNNHWTIEPRAAIRWKLSQAQSFSFAYGLNSIRERLDYYYVKAGDQWVNKELDFSKAHHFSISYSKKLSDNISLKVEPYYQYLYNIPAEPGTSFSTLNYNSYGLDKKLINNGKGRNYGIDLTLERYLKDGWYGMVTGSLFKSEYRGGDKIWRNTRMDQRFIVHALTGKEWTFGKYKHKVLSANIRLTYQGGYRYTPIDYDESGQSQDIEKVDSEAYNLRLPNMFTSDLTLRFRVNKKKVAHEYAFMILNANGFKQTGYVYNLATNSVEKKRSTPLIISLSWKIYF
ncbi:MAG: TonB-dependent receptor [Tannerellaceae bacterium]|nr:TonB-dependent receptor [Tannerellaceae bacterium]